MSDGVKSSGSGIPLEENDPTGDDAEGVLDCGGGGCWCVSAPVVGVDDFDGDMALSRFSVDETSPSLPLVLLPEAEGPREPGCDERVDDITKPLSADVGACVALVRGAAAAATLFPDAERCPGRAVMSPVCLRAEVGRVLPGEDERSLDLPPLPVPPDPLPPGPPLELPPPPPLLFILLLLLPLERCF